MIDRGDMTTQGVEEFTISSVPEFLLRQLVDTLSRKDGKGLTVALSQPALARMELSGLKARELTLF